MEGKLVAASGPGAGREEFLRGDTVVVGRSSACQIVVQDEQVSRQHAELRRQGDQWVVRDSGSANGTFVNNRRLGAGESVVLRPGDRLRLGPRAEFSFAEAYGAGGAEAYEPLATAYPSEGMYAAEQPKRGVSAPVIIVAVVAIIALAAAAYFGYRAFSGEGGGGTTEVAGGGTPSATVAARVVVQEPTTALPAAATAPIVEVPTVAVPTVSVPTVKPAVAKAASGQAGQAAQGVAQSGGQAPAAALAKAGPEQLPAEIAAAFPGVPPEQLPAAIQGALQSGQLTPDMAQGFLGGLFPGVAPAQLPTALAGSFGGFSPEQISGILNSVFPGQGLQAPQIRSGEGAVAYAAWEADDHPNTYLLNADGSGKQLLVEGASEPAFSPDGKQLAYFSWRDDALGLRIRNMGTGEDRALTNSDQDYWPSWSPDGNRLVYYNSPDNLQVINADGTDARGIGQGEFPAWSPKGDRIAYKGCVASGCGIILINPDGSNPLQITTNPNDGQPAWSPDGRSLAFVSNRDGNWEIYAVNADGSWLRRITDDIHTDGLPAWASDGMRIAFRSDRTGTWAIYTASGVGGPPVKLVDAPVRGEGDYPWDVERITWR
jgi:FHA domain/WD40-like Beta Propeller Repeat